MVLNRFLLWLTIRTGLVLATLVAIAYSWTQFELVYTPIVLIVVLIFQVNDLWRFIRRTNDNLTRFLQAIETRDFTVGFRQDKIDPSEKRLHKAFHLILDTIQESELSRQAQYLYLQGIVEHIPTGIIALNDREHIDLINPEAQSLLDIPNVANWKNLKTENSEAMAQLLQLSHGESRLLEITISGNKKYLSVSLYAFKLIDKSIRLFTIKDIANEIDQKELEAWIKLTRVLTHEIMNSVTPLLSLTETMIMVLKQPNGKAKKVADLTDETISDMVESLETIQLRSKGLLQFVEDYRRFTRVPELQPESIEVKSMISSINLLMASELQKAGIQVQMPEQSAELTIQGDRKLLEQVFINLLTNAIHALEGNEAPLIAWRFEPGDRWVDIAIKDNGRGIDPDKLEQVFIPFFSTKKDGSGIGLSLSRQIIYRHKGRIHVYSEKGVFTEMVVRLPVG
ncbi:MAG: ATP-binding protein [Imperialibacter sp.]|uniref:sensor histidine kinase n=1 Tax=Imperialibacter sp. TaxID=2038411 RepID=UPI0032EDE9CD